ncbi:TPA: hypothetical protein QCI26_003913 [Enterobacter soli]|nr:hypothetical protein [Enterobacter soli]
MSNIDKQALVIPQREKHDWSQAVMRDCDFCQQWDLTVKHSDGGCICASCCDSEYTTALSIALVVAMERSEAAEKRIAEQEAKLEIADKLQDSAFRHGLQHGFSLGQTDNQAGFEQAIEAYGQQWKGE